MVQPGAKDKSMIQMECHNLGDYIRNRSHGCFKIKGFGSYAVMDNIEGLYAALVNKECDWSSRLPTNCIFIRDKQIYIYIYFPKHQLIVLSNLYV